VLFSGDAALATFWRCDLTPAQREDLARAENWNEKSHLHPCPSRARHEKWNPHQHGLNNIARAADSLSPVFAMHYKTSLHRLTA
jgi:hypothetical protein